MNYQRPRSKSGPAQLDTSKQQAYCHAMPMPDQRIESQMAQLNLKPSHSSYESANSTPEQHDTLLPDPQVESLTLLGNGAISTKYVPPAFIYDASLFAPRLYSLGQNASFQDSAVASQISTPHSHGRQTSAITTCSNTSAKESAPLLLQRPMEEESDEEAPLSAEAREAWREALAGWPHGRDCHTATSCSSCDSLNRRGRTQSKKTAMVRRRLSNLLGRVRKSKTASGSALLSEIAIYPSNENTLQCSSNKPRSNAPRRMWQWIKRTISKS